MNKFFCNIKQNQTHKQKVHVCYRDLTLLQMSYILCNFETKIPLMCHAELQANIPGSSGEAEFVIFAHFS